MDVEVKTMILECGDHFTLNESSEDSLFNGLNIFVRNNGTNQVLVSTDGKSVLISVEKSDK